MRSRSAAAAVILFALALSLPQPAMAAGADITVITVEGPGLEQPLTLDLTDRDPDVDEFVRNAVNGVTAKTRTLTEGDLPVEMGPSYVMVLTLKTPSPAGPKQDEVEQELFPYSAGGPHTYTETGQTRQASGQSGRVAVKPGWSHFPDGLMELLHEEGLPETAPDDTNETAAPEVDTVPERPQPWLPWVILAASTVLAVVMFVIGTRRS